MPVTKIDSDRAEPNSKKKNQDRSSSPFAERRASPRCPFTAGVAAVEPASQTEIDAHTTDLSTGGCYVDTMSSFPAGTEMHLRLTKNGKSFHAKARVIYCQASVGMGLLFTEIAPAQRPVLDTWFSELRGESAPEPPIFHDGDPAPRVNSPENDERYIIEDLIALLTQKHVLTEDESEGILRRLNQ